MTCIKVEQEMMLAQSGLDVSGNKPKLTLQREIVRPGSVGIVDLQFMATGILLSDEEEINGDYALTLYRRMGDPSIDSLSYEIPIYQSESLRNPVLNERKVSLNNESSYEKLQIVAAFYHPVSCRWRPFAQYLAN